jgi:cytochrome c556
MLFLVLGYVATQSAEPPKISEFAPSKDLLQQVDFFVGRVSESLADPTDFDGAKQSRTFKDANTLAALALVLGVHDQEFPEKTGMPAMREASLRLADAGDDASRASSALEAIRKSRGGAADGAGAAKWEKTASLAALMKQVPLIHIGLKRGVEPSRLARQATQSAGQSASLAAIAQAAMLDNEYAKTSADLEQWVAFCAEMRDAAGQVNSAVHKQDQPGVAAGMKRLAASCETCHQKFRHP